MTSINILTDRFLSKYQTKQPNWGYNGLGFIVYKRTYARIKPDGKTEDWWETVARCVEGAQKIGAEYTREEAERLYDHVFNLRCSFAGRMLWQLGTPTVDRFGANSLLNCYYVSMNTPKAFLFVFENLMLGGGVGFSVRREDVHELPRVKEDVTVTHLNTKDADFIVPDSRSGWIKLLENVLEAFYVTGKSFTYSTILVRGAGESIKGFGGTASGPKILMDGIDKVAAIMRSREEKKLRSIDVLDICNVIGSIVVAGNVRRSAQIALGDPDDHLFTRAKNWNMGDVPNWRAMSNNTIYADSFEHISSSIWENGYDIDAMTGAAKGEPYGFFNLRLSQKYGRLKDGPMKDSRLYPADKDNCTGLNPCAEVTLASNETCNLAELYLNNIRSKEELIDCAKLLYKTQKAICAMPFIHKETEEIVRKNMRLGLGVTGICQAFDKIEWLDDCYLELRRFDKEWSKQRGWPCSIKLTTIKPSGCMRKDTLVSTDAGLLRLDEIGNVKGDEWQPITDLKVSTDREIQSISKFYVNGRVKTKRLLTEDGNDLESSSNHRYRVLSASGEYVWKEASMLEVGDRLVVKLDTHPVNLVTPLLDVLERETNAQKMRFPKQLDQDIAWFLGLFYGDGSVHEKGIRISFNRKQPALIDWLNKFFQDTFGLRGTVDNDHNFYVNSQQFKDWLIENGCMKDLAGDLEIPRVIRHSSKENAIAFIDGLWRADGGIHNRSTWTICTVSKEFSKQLLCLCRSVGFNVKIECAGPGGLGSQDRWIISSRFTKGDKKDRYVDTCLKNRRWNGLWLDPIVSISDSECETFDIEVDNEHCYLANSTVSHNTLSLLGGATPGVHPAYSQFYIRRVRMGSEDKLVKLCREAGYHVEYVRRFDDSEDRSTVVVEFPCETPKGAALAKDTDVIKQLEMVVRLQSIWADNAVSVTAYYDPGELPALKAWLKENYDKSIKSVSFLLRNVHGFKQAPYEEISEEVYRAKNALIKPLKAVESGEVIEGLECAGGACPLK